MRNVRGVPYDELDVDELQLLLDEDVCPHCKQPLEVTQVIREFMMDNYGSVSQNKECARECTNISCFYVDEDYIN